MDIKVKPNRFLDSFENLGTFYADEYKTKKLELFIININSNDFDYANLCMNLIEPVLDYSVSRKVREEYSNEIMLLSRKARDKFVDYKKNKGELGELMLFCFLEQHLKAPKIFTKLELKTSTSKYVNGSDGVHFLKIDENNYQLIFGESKTYVDLTDALRDAFQSIYEFKNEINDKGDEKSGIRYEKCLISDSLNKEFFSEEEQNFIKSLIYPKKENVFYVDDAFGVFIAYQLEISEELKKLPNNIFREEIKSIVKKDIEKKLTYISKKIDEKGLNGHSFYFYIVPFTKINEKRMEILEEIVK